MFTTVRQPNHALVSECVFKVNGFSEINIRGQRSFLALGVEREDFHMESSELLFASFGGRGSTNRFWSHFVHLERQ